MMAKKNKLAMLLISILACGTIALTTGCELFEMQESSSLESTGSSVEAESQEESTTSEDISTDSEETSMDSSDSMEDSSTVKEKYTITFQDEDGTVLQTSQVTEGEIPQYDGATPTKAATQQYTYTFAGWDKTLVAVSGEAVYTATYSATINQYTVTFNTDGGSTIDAVMVDYGTPASALVNVIPEKLGCTFMGWTFEDGSEIPENITVESDITVKAVWADYVTWDVPAGWGGKMTVADTSAYAEGTLLDVTMKVKQTGVTSDSNSWLLLKTESDEKNFTHNTDVAGKSRVDLATLGEWTEVNGTVKAGADGKLQLMFGTVNSTAEDCTVYVKDIEITSLSESATQWDMPYGWGGNTTLVDTDYAEGTMVALTFKVKSLNVSYTNDLVLLVNGNVWLTKFRQDLNADMYSLRNLTGWTEFKVETQVLADGKINLTYGNIDVADSTMGTVFFKDVNVEKLDVIAHKIGGEYSWGKSFTLTETDIPNGTAVTVSLRMKTANMDTGNGTYLMYKGIDGDSPRLIDPAGWDTELASNKLTAWTELTFTTIVENGQISLNWSITGPDSAWVEPNQTFFFRDVVLTPDSSITVKYEITFVVDGVQNKQEVAYGETPTFTGSTDKAADAQYTYTFAGWDKELAPVTGKATYTATYTKTTNKYLVTFLNEDGTQLQATEVEYGTVPTYNGETPTKAANVQYTYAFAGWNTELAAVNGEATYTATFSETLNKYSVKFVNYDGSELQNTQVEYGAMPKYDGATPTKPSTAAANYAFIGWDKEIAAVAGEVTYTAVFEEAAQSYMITFVDDNGETLYSAEVAYGVVPEYKGETPTKENTAQYTYAFTGWDKEIEAVSGVTTYTATYSATTNQYTVTFNTDGGSPVEAVTVDYGTPASALANITTEKSGCTFMGWTFEDGTAIPENAIVQGDITIKAAWVDYIIWNLPAGWGDKMTIADTSAYAEGTLLDITMKVKQTGVSNDSNSWLLLKTTAQEKNLTHNSDVVGKNRVNLATLGEWTEVNGTVKAGADGKLQLVFGTTNGTADACTVCVKDVEINNLADTATQWDMPYGWGGSTTLIDTDYAEGTAVSLTLKVKSIDVSYTNDVALLVNGSEWLTKFRQDLNADTYYLRNLTGWTEFTVETTTKANGIIELKYGNIDVADSTMGTVFFKDVVVEAKVVEPEEDFKLTIGDQYSWGEKFTLIETDLADGTVVTVNMNIKTSGMNSTNGTYLRYTTEDGNAANLLEPAGWDREWASDKLTSWTEVTFTTIVEGGAIKLQWNIAGPDSAYVEPNQTFYFKDIVVEAKAVEPEEDFKLTIGNQYSWGEKFTLVEADLADGTVVMVNMNIKTSGMNPTNGTYLRYTAEDGSAKNLLEPAGWNKEWASEKVTAWTEVSFTTIIEDGVIKLEWNIAGPENAYVEPNQTFYFKDIVVEAKAVEPEEDFKLTIGNQYSWGESFALAEVDVADGTVVAVTLKIKTENMNTSNGTYLIYKGTDGNPRLIDPAGWDTELASNKLTAWTELTFTTIVENGQISLNWSITGPDSAWVEPNQTFYFKDIVVEAKAVEPKEELKMTIGGEYSWGKSFALAEVDVADGTSVVVTLKIKTENMNTGNGTYLMYKGTDGNPRLIDPAGWDTELASNKLTAWTELTFTTIVENGQISLNWSITGPDSAWVEPNQTFYFADIVITVV